MSPDQASSNTGDGTLFGMLQGTVKNTVDISSNFLNRAFPPEKRNQSKEWLTNFATERPYLASFLLSQIVLSGLPLILFACMTLTVTVFALLTGILMGILGALLFITAAVGFASLFLVPTLLFTTAAAVFIWFWGVGAYLIVKWFNRKKTPGVQNDATGGSAKETGRSNLTRADGTTLNGHGGEGNAADPTPSKHKQPKKIAPLDHKSPMKNSPEDSHGSITESHHYANGIENQPHQPNAVNELSSNGTFNTATNVIDGDTSAAQTAGNATKLLVV